MDPKELKATIGTDLGRLLTQHYEVISTEINLGVTVEVQEITPTEYVLRCRSTRRSGPTTYLRVKLSEIL